MEPVQIILVAFGILIGLGGLVMMVRSAGRGESARKGYVPLAMIVVGLVIAYRCFTGFATLDGQDITIMFLFALGLFGLIGLQFLVVDQNRHHLDTPADPMRKGEGEDR